MVLRLFVLLSIFSCAGLVAFAQTAPANRDWKTVKFVTSDIDNFWRAYDLAAAETDRQKRIAIYQNEYFDKGSPGLKEFTALRIRSAENLEATIARQPKFYKSIRSETEKIAGLSEKMRKNFERFKKIYPDAVFPDVYFLVGVANSGGTVGPHGLLIGAEMQSRSSQTPMEELSPWLRQVLKSTDNIPAIVAHESCHFNQSLAPQTTLLGKAIQEGSCDFIGELVAKAIINDVQMDYGNNHESELWQEFKSSMNGTDWSKWLFNPLGVEKRPSDLGYYIGYKIAASYYSRTKGKQKAVRDILNIKDYPEFLTASQYNPPARK